MGKVVLKLGADISTDDIYPGRYMATVLPTETPQFCFFDRTEFNTQLKNKQIPQGSVIVADLNFGCGSSREQAVSTIKGHELVIVARSIARIFLQNAINLGLNIIICPEIEAEVGHELEVSKDKVVNKTTGKTFVNEQLPAARQAIIDAGGLIPYTRKLMLEATK
ncbi:MAG: 3-isopropylmalate dehydratase small subunit [Deltaproteobacteria bacterium]|nr:3-isopropylmalate dehydratase small subunit [Deltaproteobacteria bacterium]